MSEIRRAATCYAKRMGKDSLTRYNIRRAFLDGIAWLNKRKSARSHRKRYTINLRKNLINNMNIVGYWVSFDPGEAREPSDEDYENGDADILTGRWW